MILPLFFENSLPFAEAGGVGLNKKVFDMSEVQNQGDYCTLELMLKTNGTAPGAAKNLSIFMAWCTEADPTAAELLTPAIETPIVLVNSINTRRFYMTTLQYQGARFLHVWFNMDALAVGAALAGRLAVSVKRG